MLVGYELLRRPIWGIASGVLGAFLAITGIQVLLWLAGIRTELLGTAVWDDKVSAQSLAEKDTGELQKITVNPSKITIFDPRVEHYINLRRMLQEQIRQVEDEIRKAAPAAERKPGGLSLEEQIKEIKERIEWERKLEGK